MEFLPLFAKNLT